MNRLRWILATQGAILVMLAALLLLGIALGLHLAVLPTLEARAAQARAALSRVPAPVTPADDDPQRQLQSFYARFGTQHSLPDHLALLYQVARTTGISLRQAEYRLVREPDSRLRRYQIVLPVQGAYPDVRRFVSATLDSIPNAALDQVSFERRRIDERFVNAQIRLTLYLPET